MLKVKFIKEEKMNFIKTTGQKSGVLFLKLVSLLPFWIIYGISDFLYLILNYVVKYRKKVIKENLFYAFPEKTETERNKISRRFYRHLCDLSMESIKLHGMSKKQINKHIRYKGLGLINDYCKQGRSIVVLAMHHNNWEWCSSVQLFLNSVVLMIYSPMRGNSIFEKFLLDSREKWGGECVPMHKSVRRIFELNKKGETTVLWLAADQTARQNSHLWTMFFNREAPFFAGPEKIARKGNQPVFFHRIKKIKRGIYEAEFIPVFDNPAEISDDEFLLKYVEKMEEIIRKEPEYYLWSHRRWKHKRPENISLIEKK